MHYQPGEAEPGMFGGNSNWRGPVWFPLNYMLITSLRRFASFYGEGFKIECPTGSGIWLSIDEVADELSGQLTRIFRKNANGRNCYSRARDKRGLKNYTLGSSIPAFMSIFIQFHPINLFFNDRA
jgi:hypothetical protein